MTRFCLTKPSQQEILLLFVKGFAQFRASAFGITTSRTVMRASGVDAWRSMLISLYHSLLLILAALICQSKNTRTSGRLPTSRETRCYSLALRSQRIKFWKLLGSGSWKCLAKTRLSRFKRKKIRLISFSTIVWIRILICQTKQVDECVIDRLIL